jgi:hypothetical protein
MEIEPESPFVVVPELNTSPPLIPLVPAFTVLTTMEPLVVAFPSSAMNVMVPPVAPAPLPAVRVSEPP